MMYMYIAAVALGSHFTLAADRVPRFDTEPTCRSAAAASVRVNSTTENCVNAEKTAREALEQSWKQYSAVDKEHCNSLQRAGGPPSYVEFLSCLEMSRDARLLDRREKMGPDSEDEPPAALNGSGSGPRGAGVRAPRKQPVRGASPDRPARDDDD